MPAYVTLPGTSGNYFSTSDVNLLPADDSHLHQSVGNWAAGAGASTLAQDTGGTPTPQFGSGTAKATTDGTGAVIASLTTPTLTAVEHTVGIDIYTDTAGREAFITLDGTDGTVTALTAGAWTRLTATKTVTAGTKTVTVTYRQTDDSDPAASEEVWLDQAVLRTGSDGTFVPSLRIVGDLDIETKLAATDWSTGTDQWIIGNRFGNYNYQILASGSGNLYARYGTGTNQRGNTGAVSAYQVDGAANVVRCVFDISAGECLWYMDGVLRDTNTGLATDPGAHTGTYPVTVGGNATYDLPLAGNVYYAIVRDGIDGPVVARFDADDWVGV